MTALCKFIYLLLNKTLDLLRLVLRGAGGHGRAKPPDFEPSLNF